MLCTTIQKFKGLESDVVILVDVRADDLFCGRAFLYTAAARARVLLHVFEVKRVMTLEAAADCDMCHRPVCFGTQKRQLCRY